MKNANLRVNQTMLLIFLKIPNGQNVIIIDIGQWPPGARSYFVL